MLKEGKLPWNILGKYLSRLYKDDPDLVMGPRYGEDAAVIRMGDGFLVIHSDPITAATRKIGWLAIHIAANDIAVRGVKPKWFLPVILLPPGYDEKILDDITSDMRKAIDEIDGLIIGGHTEVTPGLDRPIISMTAFGHTRGRVIFTRDAKPGDLIFVIGRVGGEGAGVIAWDFEEKLTEKGIDTKIINEAKKFINDISVVKNALMIKDYVNSMHDPTEGGVIQGLREIAVASKTRVIFDKRKCILDPIVEKITKTLDIDPFKMLSSGVIIATVPPSRAEELQELLDKNNIKYSICGEILDHHEEGELIVINEDGKSIVESDVIDEIYSLWAQ